MLAASSLWQCGRTKRRRFHLCIMCCDTVCPNPSVYWVLVLNQRRPASSSFLLASLPPPSAPPVLSSPCLCFPYVSASARLSHVLWPHRELHRRSQWVRPHAVPRPFRHASHTLRGPEGNSTEGLNAWVHARPPLPAHLGTPLTRFVAPRGAPPKYLVGGRPFWHTPHLSRSPMGASTYGPNGCVHMRSPLHFGTPLTRSVAS